jgi:hypothetical protein
MTPGFFNFVLMNPADIRSYCSQGLRSSRKGPSESHMANRDKKLAYRFYYHAEHCKMNYSEILSHLHEEFDIDEKVIIRRLRQISEILDQVFAEKPSLQILKKMYPYYSW